MRLSKTLRLPKEHGAWAMLYVPFVIGALVAGKFQLALLLLLLATTAVFISRESLIVWLRAYSRRRDANGAGRMAMIYLVLASLFGLPLFFFYKLYWLVPLALTGAILLAINGKQGLDLEDRSIKGELLAIMAMSLTGPAAYYTASGNWEMTVLWLWILSVLYFASSVFYIKLRVLGLNPRRKERQQQVWQYSASYHVFLLIALVALAITGQLKIFALIAFVPVLIRAFWSLTQTSTQLNLKKAGMLEMVYSIIFLIFVTLNFRLGQ